MGMRVKGVMGRVVWEVECGVKREVRRVSTYIH